MLLRHSLFNLKLACSKTESVKVPVLYYLADKLL